MKTSVAIGLAAIAVAGLEAIAQAEEVQSGSSSSPPSTASTQTTAAEPSAQGTAPEPQAQTTPLPKPEGNAPTSTNIAGQPAQSAPSAPISKATPPQAATPPKEPKDAKAKPPWGEHKPCKNPDSEDGGDLTTDCSGIIGLRVGVTRSSGVGPGDAMSLSVSTEGEEYVRRGIWTARTLHRLSIGGGTAGFDGTLLGGWAGGVRLPIAPCHRHGPVLRLGMYGYLRGNDAYYGSLLELPQLQLGYQYMRGKIVVEFGATTGAVLIGRSRTGDSARRVLGSGFERGGYLALQFPWFRLGVSGSRLPVNDSLSTAVDVFEGSLCARISGFALCADGRATTTDAIVVAGERGSEVRSLYAGVTVGFTRE